MKKTLSNKTNRIVLWPTTDGILWYHDIEKELELIGKKLAISSNDIYFLHEQFQKAVVEIKKETQKLPLTKKLIVKSLEKNIIILQKYHISGKIFLNTWIDTNITTVNLDALTGMSMLHSKGVKNIVISDWLRKPENALLQKYKFSKYVDKIYASDNFYNINHPKAISQIVKLYKEDSYYIIGSSLEKDIAFGITAGINSVWYNPNRLPNNSQIFPTYEITNFFSLIDLIV